MINCAHPSHFADVLEPGAPWTERIAGIRANASKLSHAELDQATELDSGNPAQLAAHYTELRQNHPPLTVLGGCCGTNHQHIDAIAKSCVPRHEATPPPAATARPIPPTDPPTVAR